MLPYLRPRLEVVCQEFPDTPGVRTIKSWTKGTRRVDIHLPKYAIRPDSTEYRDTGRKLDELIEVGYRDLVGEVAAGQNDIISRTLTEALREAECVSSPLGNTRACSANFIEQV